MLVDQLLPRARNCLRVVERTSLVCNVLPVLSEPGVNLLVVSRAGRMAGVVTKTDIITTIRRFPTEFALNAPMESIMSTEVQSCTTGEPLLAVWMKAKASRLRHLPVVDKDNRPIGVLQTSDALQALLEETAIEDAQLRDYIRGVGYL